jgi:DNA-binding MarR family transcriptional regulator
MTLLLAALWDPDWKLALQHEGEQYPWQLDDEHLSRTLLLGLMVFACFRPNGEYRRVSEIAQALKMTPSTAHRYVSTLVAVGLLEREPELRMYRAMRTR